MLWLNGYLISYCQLEVNLYQNTSIKHLIKNADTHFIENIPCFINRDDEIIILY